MISRQMEPLVFDDLVVPVPIVQGGMGVGISLSGLASAVAAEGGVGTIAAAMIGMNEPDIRTNHLGATLRALKREIELVKQKTVGVLGVNIMVALNYFDDMVRTAAEAGADIIFSGAGLPLSMPKLLPEGSRTKLVPIVSSGRAAGIICRKWKAKFGRLPDGFVVEGPMAGGHLGFSRQQLDQPEYALERLVVDVVQDVAPFAEAQGRPIPIIAAGGIYTGQDICRFLKLGASGVQMGTRFVATHECDADQGFKDSYINASQDDITIIESPVGMPGRAIKNAFLEEVGQGLHRPGSCPYRCIITCDREKSPYCIARALMNAKLGHLTKGFAFAGANAWRVKAIVTVRELMNELKAEYAQACATA